MPKEEKKPYLYTTVYRSIENCLIDIFQAFFEKYQSFNMLITIY